VLPYPLCLFKNTLNMQRIESTNVTSLCAVLTRNSSLAGSA
jgi:hypothetical protein